MLLPSPLHHHHVGIRYSPSWCWFSHQQWSFTNFGPKQYFTNVAVHSTDPQLLCLSCAAKRVRVRERERFKECLRVSLTLIVFAQRLNSLLARHLVVKCELLITSTYCRLSRSQVFLVTQYAGRLRRSHWENKAEAETEAERECRESRAVESTRTMGVFHIS